MKTPEEFDYDLWTTEEDSVKHYWTRIKATGEVSEVSHEVMKYLRSLEAQIHRKLEAERERGGSDLSLDAVPTGGSDSAWATDPKNMEEDVISCLVTEEFRDILTDKQRSLFDVRYAGDLNCSKFAKSHGLNHKTVLESVGAIQKKYIKNFE